jgi:hypothetical protein
MFRPERLTTMRTRLSAAYKGIHALLMREGAKDFRSGQAFDQTVFFDEAVDIHHIFPQAWCQHEKIDARVYDTVVNKTPLGYRTNRIIGGIAPSKYLKKLEDGQTDPKGRVVDPPIDPSLLDTYLESHCIPVAHLRADDFKSFMRERRKALLALVAAATGHPINDAADEADEGEEASDEVIADSGLSATA